MPFQGECTSSSPVVRFAFRLDFPFIASALHPTDLHGRNCAQTLLPGHQSGMEAAARWRSLPDGRSQSVEEDVRIGRRRRQLNLAVRQYFGPVLENHKWRFHV